MLGFELRRSKQIKPEVTEKEEKKMKTAKLGAIFLIAVMALAGAGVGYAAWFDTITISGTVNTGNVDIVITRLSETYVYKDLDTDEAVICHKYINLPPLTGGLGSIFWDPAPPSNGLLVAKATATVDKATAYDELYIEFSNLFPCIDFYVDVLFHYEGSIPVKINFADFDSVFGLGGDNADWLHYLWNMHQIDSNFGIWVTAYRANADGTLILDDNNEPIPVDVGTQLHYCDYVYLELHIHLPQWWDVDGDGIDEPTDWLMLRNGGFTAHIEVIQWNEYEED